MKMKIIFGDENSTVLEKMEEEERKVENRKDRDSD